MLDGKVLYSLYGYPGKEVAMKDNLPNPVMALNPYTNKLVNVEPFFEFLKEQSDAKESIDSVIRTLVTILSDTDDDHRSRIHHRFGLPSDMYFFLYDLSDLFQKIAECEISMPKRKGGNE